MAEEMEDLVELARSAYEAFNRGDFDAATAFMDPEIEWARVADVEQPLHGRAAVREFMTPEVFAKQHSEVHGIEVIGDALLVDATFTGLGSQSGAELTLRGYHLWRIRGGKAISFRYFTDREEALEAARSEGA